MRSSESSLARRVRWTAATAACGAGIVTLAVASLVIDQVERSTAQDDLLSLADALVREIDQPGHEEREALADEVREFTLAGMSIAIVESEGDWLAGDVSLPVPATHSCEVSQQGPTPWLVCARPTNVGRRVVVVGEPMEQVLAHRTPLMLGGAIALAVALIGSILAGLWVSRWSLGPLEKLERFLVGIDTEHPEQGPSLVRSGLREVDSIGTALEDLLARLSDELVRSRRFSADAAHELRTPLSKIRTELELVEEEAGAETRMAIRRAVAKTDELTVLMDRLLVLASPGDVIRDRTLTALSVVFETVVEELEPTVASRVRLELDADGLVVGNQAIFRSVASNAIENAAKYSEGEIRVRVWEEHEQVVVRVDDDGPGLGKDERLRAFEPFYRGVLNRATPGTGIGLALIAHVVRSHHGTARFLDSELGAKLELRLPAHLG